MKKKHNITPEQCLEAYEKHGTKQAAADSLDLPVTTFRSYLKKAKVKQSKSDSQPPLFEKLEVIFKDKRTLEKLSLAEMIEGFKKAQGFRAKFDIKQLQASCEIPAKKPIALVHFSDVHFGSPSVDYEAILEDAELIKQNKNLFVMLGGDLSDKMGTFRDASTAGGQLHPIKIQLAAQEKYIDYLGDRIVAKIGWGV